MFATITCYGDVTFTPARPDAPWYWISTTVFTACESQMAPKVPRYNYVVNTLLHVFGVHATDIPRGNVVISGPNNTGLSS